MFESLKEIFLKVTVDSKDVDETKKKVKEIGEVPIDTKNIKILKAGIKGSG